MSLEVVAGCVRLAEGCNDICDSACVCRRSPRVAQGGRGARLRSSTPSELGLKPFCHQPSQH